MERETIDPALGKTEDKECGGMEWLYMSRIHILRCRRFDGSIERETIDHHIEKIKAKECGGMEWLNRRGRQIQR